MESFNAILKKEEVNFEDKTYSIKFEKFATIRTISAHINLEKIETDNYF